MKNLNKILIVPILLSCSILNLVSADNSDCGTFATMSYSNSDWWDNGFWIVNLSRWTDSNKFSNFMTKEQQLAIIDKESINTAILNLKKYCCEKNLWWLNYSLDTCKQDKVFFNDNIIDSQYFFDHLFDVVMRRLSGLSGEYDIYTKTNMSVDSLGWEWRSWIVWQAENVSWVNPQIIIDKYQEFWHPSAPQLWYDVSNNINTSFWDLSDQDFLLYVSGNWWSQESKDIADALKNYDNWTLYDRYNNACAITQYLYALLDLWLSSEDKNRTINNLAKWYCKQATKSQIDNENLYVKLVILQAGNLFLQNYRQWYISYLYDRSKILTDTWRNITNKFLDVVKGVPHLVHTSVK